MMRKAETSHAFFARLPAESFYSRGPASPVQQVYLYGEVSEDSLRKLRADIDDASKGSVDEAGNAVAPKPIVLHVNSPGGNGYAGMSMMSVFNESRVPICVCVDGISASAATFVSVLAPYRVMAAASTCLIHDYSTTVNGKRDDQLFHTQVVNEHLTAVMRDVYLKRTRIGATPLAELMSRDRLLDAQTCLKLGVCDRVLNFALVDAMRGALGLSVVLRKTNLNHVRFDCAATDDFARAASERLDDMIGAGDVLKPVVLHADGLACLRSVSDHAAPIAHRIAALGMVADTYGVIDAPVTLVNVLPLLYCKRRVMYRHASIIIHMVYEKEMPWMLRDIVDNTALIMSMVRHMLRLRTRLPAEIVDTIDRKRTLLTAADCLKYGVVDELIG
jgi:ATP-dependent protease ClpP protease subunit